MKGATSMVTCPTCKGKRPTVNRCITCDKTGRIMKMYARGMKDSVPKVGRIATSESRDLQQQELWNNIHRGN